MSQADVVAGAQQVMDPGEEGWGLVVQEGILDGPNTFGQSPILKNEINLDVKEEEKLVKSLDTPSHVIFFFYLDNIQHCR